MISIPTEIERPREDRNNYETGYSGAPEELNEVHDGYTAEFLEGFQDSNFELIQANESEDSVNYMFERPETGNYLGVFAKKKYDDVLVYNDFGLEYFEHHKGSLEQKQEVVEDIDLEVEIDQEGMFYTHVSPAKLRFSCESVDDYIGKIEDLEEAFHRVNTGESFEEFRNNLTTFDNRDTKEVILDSIAEILQRKVTDIC